jgi:crotonobetainyl-CoA:carnitine CoA-transferase CaiB-like acyl-CoA transferase
MATGDAAADTEALLKALGYSAQRIASLKEAQVV